MGATSGAKPFSLISSLPVFAWRDTAIGRSNNRGRRDIVESGLSVDGEAAVEGEVGVAVEVAPGVAEEGEDDALGETGGAPPLGNGAAEETGGDVADVEVAVGGEGEEVVGGGCEALEVGVLPHGAAHMRLETVGEELQFDCLGGRGASADGVQGGEGCVERRVGVGAALEGGDVAEKGVGNHGVSGVEVVRKV